MNKTKRKIFETSMKLFAEKGYDATSVEEITSVVGVAKGTLYYHFSSKEEIFYFLVEEGMKLLQNSITIKISQQTSSVEKLKSVLLIQSKILTKYQDFITIVVSQMWGNERRNKKCREFVEQYIKIIKVIIDEGIKNKEIVAVDSETLAVGIFSTTYVSLYKSNKDGKANMHDISKDMQNILFNGLKK
ncbi:MAG: TetR/AcrR family transcriptional regulator [Clostridia bacterium]|nr:TetR/AcrR family transcriptional regulator [Clostridia bacterium]